MMHWSRPPPGFQVCEAWGPQHLEYMKGQVYPTVSPLRSRIIPLISDHARCDARSKDLKLRGVERRNRWEVRRKYVVLVPKGARHEGRMIEYRLGTGVGDSIREGATAGPVMRDIVCAF